MSLPIFTPKMMQEKEATYLKNEDEAYSWMQLVGEQVGGSIIEENSFSKILLLVGKGNNGGDALSVGVHLLRHSLQPVAFLAADHQTLSPLCKKALEEFLDAGGKLIDILDGHYDLIVDGLFGVGFKGKLEAPWKGIIEWANQSKTPIYALDIPSGLDGETGLAQPVAIHATKTYWVGLPKIGFFLGDGWDYVGKLKEVKLPISEKLAESKTPWVWSTIKSASALMPAIHRTRNKYERGVATLVAGSSQYPGSLILATKAALRGGAGMVYAAPRDAIDNSRLTPEIILLDPASHAKNPKAFDHADCILIGSGLGRDEASETYLKKILEKPIKAAVIDGDGIYYYSLGKITPSPREVLLTPHKGELGLLLGETLKDVDFALLQKTQEYVEKKKVSLILKGGPSFFFTPQKPIRVITTGSPAMATAGTGDVFAGLVTALIAQKMTLENACLLGAHIHGLAGEIAEEIFSGHSVIASDLIELYPEAFKILSA